MKNITIKLPHITLGGLAFGSPDKPLLLALHGWLDNAASFIPLAQYLSDYHIIAVEWPGHGHSMHREAGANYHITDYIFDLHALSGYLDRHYHCDKLTILGHSLGGIVSSLYAGTFSDRVEKLVLIESFGPLVAKPSESVAILKKSIEQASRAKSKPMPVHPTLQSAITARQSAGDFSCDIASLLVERGSVEVTGGYTWRSDARLRKLSPIRMTEEQAQEFLAAITAPVLLILAESGLAFSRDSLTKRQAIMSDLKTLNFAGGHHVHMEQPEHIALAISEFLTTAK